VVTGMVAYRAELIAQGREAARSGCWPDAFDALTAADVAGTLDADDLEVLGWAALITARPEGAVAASQRAFAAVRATDPRRPALTRPVRLRA
jgi:hypothetical protein